MLKKNFVTKKAGTIAFNAAIFIPAIAMLLISLVISVADIDAADISIWLLLGISQLCIVAAGLGTIFYTKTNFIAAMTFNKKPKALNIVLLAVLSISLIVFVLPIQSAFLNLLQSIGIKLESSVLEFDSFGVGGYIFAFILVAIIPAFAEEIIYRGFVLEGNRQKKFDIVAIVISALLFTVMHKSIEQFINPLILGFVMGFIYCATCSIWSTIILHFFNNAFVMVLSLIPGTEQFLLTNWWLLFPAAVVAAGMLLLIWKTNKAEQYEIEKPLIENEKHWNYLLIPGALYSLIILIYSMFA